ncbi:MAG: carbon-nitrogen family hydrolase [Planctomycetes bacterium]|nr:carbon-nitrogen family hydrolase [Planctomycetota bacterium]
MKVLAVQLDIAWEDKQANFARVREALATAAPPPGSLIVLSEMFATGFSLDVAVTAEAPGGETAQFLAEIARVHKAFVIGGLAVKGPDRQARNMSLTFGPKGDELSRNYKMHAFTPSGEEDFYAPGDTVAVAQIAGLGVCTVICYDLRFPEVFRAGLRRGAQLFAVIASWPAERRSHWCALLKARAVENQAYVVGVNRCGRDPNHSFAGDSVIIDPRGEVLREAGAEQCVIAADVEAQSVVAWREQFPAIADMRTDYSDL